MKPQTSARHQTSDLRPHNSDPRLPITDIIPPTFDLISDFKPVTRDLLSRTQTFGVRPQTSYQRSQTYSFGYLAARIRRPTFGLWFLLSDIWPQTCNLRRQVSVTNWTKLTEFNLNRTQTVHSNQIQPKSRRTIRHWQHCAGVSTSLSRHRYGISYRAKTIIRIRYGDVCMHVSLFLENG